MPSESSSGDAEGVLGCEDLATVDAVAAALTGADGVVPEPVAAVQPSAAFSSMLLTGVGGLSCSWRVGEGQLQLGDATGDWAYLQIDVMPKAAQQYTALWAGDSPSTDTVDVGGIAASVSEGETGWQLSAPVADSWVKLGVRSSGLMTDSSRFQGMPQGAVTNALAAVAADTFAVLEDASAQRLNWPALETRTEAAACDGGLDEAAIASALTLDPANTVEYVLIDSRASVPDYFDGAVEVAAGVFSCELRTTGHGTTTITAVRGFAPMLPLLRDHPDSSTAFVSVALAGAVEPEFALEAVLGEGLSSPVYFIVGDTLYNVYSEGARAVAEAIIAHTR